MDKKDLNLKILNEIAKYIYDNPEQRFGQILRNMGILSSTEVPDFFRVFYEEPSDTLKKIEEFKKERGIYD